MLRFRELLYFVLIIMLFVSIPMAGAQSNPCDAIEVEETISVTPDTTAEEIQLRFFERAVINAYLEGDDGFALAIIEEMLAVDDEYAPAYFYEGCIYLETDDESDAIESFETFLEFSDDEALGEDVEALIADIQGEGDDSAEVVVVEVDRETGDIVLEGYQEDGETILQELETNGLFPSGSEFVFSEDFISYTSDGVQFNSYATGDDFTNYVMGATLTFTPEGRGVELCGLLGHAQRTGSYSYVRLTELLVVGLDSDGSIFLVENTGDDNDQIVDINEAGFDLDDPVQITVLVLDDALTVYANGEVMFEDYELQGGGSGSFAFYFLSADQTSRCQATEMFAYALADGYVDDACVVRSNGTVNRRTGPGTTFDRDGELLSGEELDVTGQAMDTSGNGFTWWQLEDGAWVREDVVNVEGYCRTLDVIDVE